MVVELLQFDEKHLSTVEKVPCTPSKVNSKRPALRNIITQNIEKEKQIENLESSQKEATYLI